MAGRDVNPTGSRGDHDGVVRESLSRSTRNLLALAESNNGNNTNSPDESERRTLARILGSSRTNGSTNQDGSSARQQTLMEMDANLTSGQVYAALEDARGQSWTGSDKA